jgi:hypothetical protein
MKMISSTALHDWADLYQGRMYPSSDTNAYTDAPDKLAQVLNNMIMVAGSSGTHTPNEDWLLDLILTLHQTSLTRSQPQMNLHKAASSTKSTS